MKYCPKCNKVFQNEASFCGNCGSPLEAIEYDIFGEPMENKKPKYERPFSNTVNATYSTERKENKNALVAEVLALITVGSCFVPIYGSVIAFVALMTNIRAYKEYKRNLGYLILSVVTLLFSIYFFYLLLASGTLMDLIGEVQA